MVRFTHKRSLSCFTPCTCYSRSKAQYQINPHGCIIIFTSSSVLIKIMNELEKNYKREVVDRLIIFPTGPTVPLE